MKHSQISFLDITLNKLMVRLQQSWSFRECGVPLYCHRSHVHFGPDLVLSMGQTELNSVLMLNWTVWNRTIFIVNCVNKKLYLSSTELFEIELFWYSNWELMLYWIVWNRTVLCIKMDLASNNLQWLICLKPTNQPTNQTNNRLSNRFYILRFVLFYRNAYVNRCWK